MIAAATSPTVIAGQDDVPRASPPGPRTAARIPTSAASPAWSRTDAISRIPSQKSGTETPNWLVTRTIASLTRPSRSADQMPAGRAISSAMTMPTTAERHGGGQPLEQRHA